jgi:hypothetical protein
LGDGQNSPRDSLGLLQELLELVGSISVGADVIHALWSRRNQTAALGLDASKLEFGGTELTSGSSLLLEHLLLLSVRVADLDGVLFAARLSDDAIVEVLDDLLADITRFETMSVSS